LFSISGGNVHFPGLSDISSRSPQYPAQVRRFNLISIDDCDATHTQMDELAENHGTCSAEAYDNDVKVS
jgi:hypothetical protein